MRLKREFLYLDRGSSDFFKDEKASCYPKLSIGIAIELQHVGFIEVAC